MSKCAVIGAGAAGCFCAIELKRRLPSCAISVLEAGDRPLAKVAITGGGRCNLTNTFENIRDLGRIYPRGTQMMKRALKRFSNKDAMAWFEREGVALTIQEDGCVFPESQDAMQIVDTLTSLMNRLGVKVSCGKRVQSVRRSGNSFEIVTGDGTEQFDAVIVTTGGSPKISGLQFLSDLEIALEAPVPSLFTFRLKDEGLSELMGAVTEKSHLFIPGTKFRSDGPLLITDWGLSGPSALKLSSYAARHLAGCGYNSPVAINWMGQTETEAREMLARMNAENSRKMIAGTHPDALSSRLWGHLLKRSGLREDIRWAEMGSKGSNRLVNTLISDTYTMTGRAAFKGEFVTCGGVSLDSIDINTLECKAYPGLYFAGEVTDMDAITGGFNLQGAWSTGYIAAQSAAEFLKQYDTR